MNLSFLKVRVADCPWIVFDGTAVSGARRDAPKEPDWGAVATAVCDRYRGAAANGVVVVTGGEVNRLDAWTARGAPCPPPPAAELCAARWLFDAGRAGSDIVATVSGYGESEAMVIDSRNFGLLVGAPERQDGGPLAEAFGGGALGVSASAGSGLLVPMRVGDRELAVALFYEPPARRRGPRSGDTVEVLVVARHELRVRRGRHDPIVAAAAALAAAVAADYADRELTVVTGGDRLVAQWPEGGPVFVAAAPAYCLSGELWADEQA